MGTTHECVQTWIHYIDLGIPLVQLPTVMVVHNNLGAARAIRDCLIARGYDVAVAFAAPDALRLAGQFRVSLMVVDIDLEKISGVELIRWARSDQSLSTVPVILLIPQHWIDSAMQSPLPNVTMLAKPVDLDELAFVVGKLIEGPPRLDIGVQIPSLPPGERSLPTEKGDMHGENQEE